MKPIVNISIALCTYNGEHYIAEQLDSIARQSRLPDEIILCDDCSEDSTVEIVRRYQNCLPIQVIINEQRLGTTLNFSKAIARCIGDVIFLCDQDDVWAADKIEKILETFLSSRAGLVFSDAQLIGADSMLIGESLWKVNRFSKARQELFNRNNALAHLLRSNIVTGATTAFRSDFKDVILPIPINWIHDYWIATLISAIAPIHLEHSPLVRYRLHATQQIGIHRNLLGKLITLTNRKPDWQIEEAKYIELRDRIKNYTTMRSLPDEITELLDKKLSHIAARGSISSGCKIGGAQMLREIFLGNYSKFSYGWLDIALDIRKMFL